MYKHIIRLELIFRFHSDTIGADVAYLRCCDGQICGHVDVDAKLLIYIIRAELIFRFHSDTIGANVAYLQCRDGQIRNDVIVNAD